MDVAIIIFYLLTWNKSNSAFGSSLFMFHSDVVPSEVLSVEGGVEVESLDELPKSSG